MSSLDTAYQYDQLQKDEEFKQFQSSLGSYGSSPEFQSSLEKNPQAWKELSKFKDISATLMRDQKSWQQTVKNPKQATKKLGKIDMPSSDEGEEDAPVSQIVVPDEVIPPEQRDPNALGLEASVDLGPITEQLDRAQMSMDESISKLESANEPLLRGEIPEDVQSQLRRGASEKIQRSGFGGQSAEARSARDLGLTSMQLQEAGFQRQTGIAEARRAQAAFLESRREYEKNYQMQSRQFVEDMRRTDIQAKELDQIRRRFNAEQNLNLIKLVSELASTRAQIRQQYDIADKEGGTDTVAGLNNVIGQLDRILARPGLVT